jgi:hypothetical protein
LIGPLDRPGKLIRREPLKHDMTGSSYYREPKMTICICGACNRSREGGAKIILCTDWRQSSGLGSADVLFKQQWLPENWICLTAGDTDEINAVLRLMDQNFGAAGLIDETNVKRLIEESLRARLSEKRDALSYSRFSMSYKELYDTGKLKLPDAHFSKFVTDISEIRLSAEFIVAGLYNDDQFILETRATGEVFLPNDFSCVGEGEYLAYASLMRRSYQNIMTFGTALYVIYEAKKAADSVNSVG